MKIWINTATGDWGYNPEDLVLVEVPDGMDEVLENALPSVIAHMGVNNGTGFAL